MKNSKLIPVSLILFLTVIFSSCEAIAGIFKAGMGFGIFIVVAILVLIAYLIMRSSKK